MTAQNNTLQRFFELHCQPWVTVVMPSLSPDHFQWGSSRSRASAAPGRGSFSALRGSHRPSDVNSKSHSSVAFRVVESKIVVGELNNPRLQWLVILSINHLHPDKLELSGPCSPHLLNRLRCWTHQLPLTHSHVPRRWLGFHLMRWENDLVSLLYIE